MFNLASKGTNDEALYSIPVGIDFIIYTTFWMSIIIIEGSTRTWISDFLLAFSGITI